MSVEGTTETTEVDKDIPASILRRVMGMKITTGVLLLLLQVSASQKAAIIAAAKKAVPGVTWKADSIVTGDFTCRGHREQAILGADPLELVVVVFINGVDKTPEILWDKIHVRADAQLTTESMDYDPTEIIGVVPEGFERSKACQGLNIADDHTDSFHVYWNHKNGVFDWWSL